MMFLAVSSRVPPSVSTETVFGPLRRPKPSTYSTFEDFTSPCSPL